ncbi:ARM repeat-containing protein [Exidia glandulosa HHB12029]|uniref:ARM repeat-containing protein n=1 Tax=Exidia glandulosa HHB12029 TaxID=1314781 RepID=A0A165DVE2_EXIGL|nr:ARM repeat-containing protein [Exidia glandulosa HHB12029]
MGSTAVYPSDDQLVQTLQTRFRADLPYTWLGHSALVQPERREREGMRGTVLQGHHPRAQHPSAAPLRPLRQSLFAHAQNAVEPERRIQVPEAFLKENNLYEPLVVGKYCEKRDPYLAFIAYAKGMRDDELQQARYLVKRRLPELWAQVLSPDNGHRRQLIDQIIATAIPECTDPDDVSVTVKAFIVADLPSELIELLEKIIVEPSPFSDNKSLQNLLMLTAICADKGKVVGYNAKLSNYDVLDIAKVATEHASASTAVICLRFGAASRRLNSTVFASRTRLTRTSRLAPSKFAEVIEIVNHAGKNDDLVRFSQMACKTLREPKIDTELAYAYAKPDRLHDREEFLSMTNVAGILNVGEKCVRTNFTRPLFSSI